MGANGTFRMDYPVDIVFCIDATESMHPFMNNLKDYAMRLHREFMKQMEAKGKTVGQVRIRIVAFRDYIADGEDAMLVTDFFQFPEQASEFRRTLDSIETKGGGDDPEDGLEALAFAMKSNWCRKQGKKRQVIMVFTDDATHEIGFGKSMPNYPKNMPKDFSALTEWWNDENIISQNAKRLLIFAPAKPYWTTIYDYWNQVVHIETETAGGLEGEDLEKVLKILAQSI